MLLSTSLPLLLITGAMFWSYPCAILCAVLGAVAPLAGAAGLGATGAFVLAVSTFCMKSLNVVWVPVFKPFSPASYLCFAVGVVGLGCDAGVATLFACESTNPLFLNSLWKLRIARKSDEVLGALIWCPRLSLNFRCFPLLVINFAPYLFAMSMNTFMAFVYPSVILCSFTARLVSEKPRKYLLYIQVSTSLWLILWEVRRSSVFNIL